MITDKRIATFITKEQALALYRGLMDDDTLTISSFTEWAEFSRQAYYSWPSVLPSALRFQLYGRLAKLKTERETHGTK